MKRRKRLGRKTRLRPVSRRRSEHYDDYIATRSAVYQRDGWRCKRCGSKRKLTPHHLLSRARGGPDTLENMVTICKSCHILIEDHACDDWRDWIRSSKG